MYGPEIIARTISATGIPDKFGNEWQYHSRSDLHSKAACWAILFDLIDNCPLLASQVAARKVGFGINHEMRDFKVNRKKDLDLVICKLEDGFNEAKVRTFSDLAQNYNIMLDASEKAKLEKFPPFYEASVTTVLAALEAKACMTAHAKARPRLYDELTSSHMTVHGDTSSAIAVGFVMINSSDKFISPIQAQNKVNFTASEPLVNHETQPRATLSVIEKMKELPRSSKDGEPGFDALGIVIINCKNDGSIVSVVNSINGDSPVDRIYQYETMINRVSQIYTTRFREL